MRTVHLWVNVGRRTSSACGTGQELERPLPRIVRERPAGRSIESFFQSANARTHASCAHSAASSREPKSRNAARYPASNSSGNSSSNPESDPPPPDPQFSTALRTPIPRHEQPKVDRTRQLRAAARPSTPSRHNRDHRSGPRATSSPDAHTSSPGAEPRRSSGPRAAPPLSPETRPLRRADRWTGWRVG